MRIGNPHGQSPATMSEHLAPEDLLANTGLWRRLFTLALIGVVAAPIVPPREIAVWLALYLPVTIVEILTLTRRGYIGRDFVSLFVTFTISALHAVAAASLIQ